MLRIESPEYQRKQAERVGAVERKAAEFLRENPEDARGAWLIRRLAGITGSTMAACLGLNRWKTPYQAWLDYTGRNIKPFTGNAATEWGNRLEDVVADAYAEKLGVKIATCDLIRSKKYPFLLATLDRLVIDGNDTPVKVLEIKTAGQNYATDMINESGEPVMAWGPGNVYADGACVKTDDQVPTDYKLQVMHYMIVTGLREADIAVLLGGNDFRIFTIKYDAELAEEMIRAADEFWCGYVLDDVAPPRLEVDVKDITPVKDSVVEATDEMLEQLKELKDIQDKLKQLDARKTELRNSLLGQIGDHDTLQLNGQCLATYKMRAGRKSFNTKQFQADHPDLFEQYQTTSAGSRVFLMK